MLQHELRKSLAPVRIAHVPVEANSGGRESGGARERGCQTGDKHLVRTTLGSLVCAVLFYAITRKCRHARQVEKLVRSRLFGYYKS